MQNVHPMQTPCTHAQGAALQQVLRWCVKEKRERLLLAKQMTVS